MVNVPCYSMGTAPRSISSNINSFSERNSEYRKAYTRSRLIHISYLNAQDKTAPLGVRNLPLKKSFRFGTQKRANQSSLLTPGPGQYNNMIKVREITCHVNLF